MEVVKLNGDRGQLQEGRQQGLGFTILRKTDTQFESVSTLSTCKDYLNDVLAVEKFGNKDTPISVFGLGYKYRGDVLNSDGSGYLYIQPLSFKTKQPDFVKVINLDYDNKQLERNIPNILKLLRRTERYLNFTSRTQIMPTTITGGYIVHGGKEWFDSPYMLSLYTLLIRALSYVDYESPLTVLFGANSLDSSQLSSAKQMIHHLKTTKKLPEYTIKNFVGAPTSASIIHGGGSVYYTTHIVNPALKDKIHPISGNVMNE